MPNMPLVKPIQFIFNCECFNDVWKKSLNNLAVDKAYYGQIRLVIIESLETYKLKCPQAMITING